MARAAFRICWIFDHLDSSDAVVISQVVAIARRS